MESGQGPDIPTSLRPVADPDDAEVYLVIEYLDLGRPDPLPFAVELVVGDDAAYRAIQAWMESNPGVLYHAVQVVSPERFPIHFITRN